MYRIYTLAPMRLTPIFMYLNYSPPSYRAIFRVYKMVYKMVYTMDCFQDKKSKSWDMSHLALHTLTNKKNGPGGGGCTFWNLNFRIWFFLGLGIAIREPSSPDLNWQRSTLYIGMVPRKKKEKKKRVSGVTRGPRKISTYRVFLVSGCHMWICKWSKPLLLHQLWHCVP